MIGLVSCSFDLRGTVPSFPWPNSKNNVVRFIQRGGGPVVTALVALTRLGARVNFMGKLRSNEFSRFVVDEFTQEGVDTSSILKEEKGGSCSAFVGVDEKKGFFSLPSKFP